MDGWDRNIEVCPPKRFIRVGIISLRHVDEILITGSIETR